MTREPQLQQLPRQLLIPIINSCIGKMQVTNNTLGGTWYICLTLFPLCTERQNSFPPSKSQISAKRFHNIEHGASFIPSDSTIKEKTLQSFMTYPETRARVINMLQKDLTVFQSSSSQSIYQSKDSGISSGFASIDSLQSNSISQQQLCSSPMTSQQQLEGMVVFSDITMFSLWNCGRITCLALFPSLPAIQFLITWSKIFVEHKQTKK